MIRILAIDDDPDFLYALTRITGRLGHECAGAGTLARAREQAAKTGFDLVLLDVGLPDGTGLDLLPELRALPSRPEVVIITGAGDAAGAEMAITNGAWDYIEKSASAKAISLTISRALQFRAERQKSLASDHPAGGRVTALKRDAIIGESPKIKQALDRVAKAAAGTANVLVTGDTGTGKELFARAIHMNSDRSGKEMVTVDCAALPENLAENLLFGHTKGVYTGADAARQGLIKMADQGSLFLDEIGELPLALQKTLLRVLQEKRFRPLGKGREVASDFRIIAATNRDLNREAEAGRFRKDLLFRIRSLHIRLPSLKEREGDIRILARHYLDRFCRDQGVDSKGVSSDFFDILDAHDWPGNVRELAHTMEHTVLAALSDATVFPAHLPNRLRVQVVTAGLAVRGKTAESAPHEYDPARMPSLGEFRDSVLARYEKRYLIDLMAGAPDIKTACTVSGLSRSRLYALLKKYGLSSK